MNRELFGVFGDRETFERHRASDEFDRILTGSSITVGIRDDALGATGWTASYADGDARCVVWGEAYVPGDESNAARWLLERYEQVGRDALGLAQRLVSGPRRRRHGQCVRRDGSRPVPRVLLH